MWLDPIGSAKASGKSLVFADSRKEKTMRYGWVWIDGYKKKPICHARPIRRGKNKGKWEVKLCRGRNGDGTIKPGRKKIIPFKCVIEMPMEEKSA